MLIFEFLFKKVLDQNLHVQDKLSSTHF